MNDDNKEFTVVPHQDGALSYHLEEGSLIYKSIFYSTTRPFMGTYEELGCTREVVEMFQMSFCGFSVVVLKFKWNCDYTHVFDQHNDTIEICSPCWLQRYVLKVHIKLGADRVRLHWTPECILN